MLVKKKLFLEITVLTVFFVVTVIFLFPYFVQAQVDTGLGYLESSGLAVTDIRITIARIIRIALGLLGAIATVIILYGGFLWMTAAGNEEKMETAKKILKNGAIGLAIIITSFSIASFVLNSLLRATGVTVGGGETPATGAGGGGLGFGIIQSHYPARNAKEIPRNTKVVVTFKESIKADTLIKDGADEGEIPGDSLSDRLITTSVRIIKKGDSFQTGPFVEASAMATSDNKTFVFKPLDLLGSSSVSTDYIVLLSNDIKKADGKNAFSGADRCENNSGVYCWGFTVSTFVDITPPQVVNVFPANDSEGKNPVARNAVAQINFSEPIDPLSAAGVFPPFENISVKENGVAKEGGYNIGNEYQAVEFIPNVLCGQNSCGQDVFCLPPNAQLTALAKSIDPEKVSFPYGGVVDMCDNPLDGDGDGAVDKKEGDNYPDNYSWSFATSDEVDLTSPAVEKIIHQNKDNTGEFISPPDGVSDILDNINKTEPIEIYFSKAMMVSLINNSNVVIEPQDAKWYGWFYPISKNESVEVDGRTLRKTRTSLKHDIFFESSGYWPSISSQLKDVYQNCLWDSANKKVPGPEIVTP
ncbi:MAG: Ig-like domain-containing protein [Patescibacteria group bacterium]|nr:Ig-like domain-containing protein [Patescibacteria group bacterium]MDD5490241.1 Ig-like domain-containing protein [Patescibacteria group bacterium]